VQENVYFSHWQWFYVTAHIFLLTFRSSLLNSHELALSVFVSSPKAAFWEEDPHRPTFAAVQAEEGLSWPSSFDARDGDGGGGKDGGAVVAPADAVTPLGGDEIFVDIRLVAGAEDVAKEEEASLNLMSPTTFFSLSEGLLGLGMRQDISAHTDYE
jgi:hypothetical protein